MVREIRSARLCLPTGSSDSKTLFAGHIYLLMCGIHLNQDVGSMTITSPTSPIHRPTSISLHTATI
jgi:hypothetical protein